jgi:endonuclease-3
VKIEQDLMKLVPQKEWTVRTICVARKPKCSQCFLNDVCPSAEEPLE